MAYNADSTFLPSWGSGMKPPPGHDSPATSSDDLKDTKSTNDGFGCCKKPSKTSKTASKKTRSGVTQQQQSGPLYGAGYGSAGSLGSIGKPRKVWIMADGTLTCMMIVLPFLAFAITALAFLSYWKHAWLAHLAILILIACSGACFYLGGVKAKGIYEDNKVTDQFLVCVGGSVFFLTILAVLVGMLGYVKYTTPYQIAVNSRYYENVMPSENPNAKRDASMIQFAPGAKVDSTKSLGFKDSSMYCVAPILGYNSDTFVGYWAAGIDCCASRGSFLCDDVSDYQVRGGLIIEPLKMYNEAAAQAAAQYDLSIPAEPVFIQWVADPIQANYQTYLDGKNFTMTFILVIFIVCLVVGMVINFIHGKKRNGDIDRLYSIGPNEEGSHKPDPFAKGMDLEGSMLQPMTSDANKTQPLMATDANKTIVSEGGDSTLPATTQVTQMDPDLLMPQGERDLKLDPFMTTKSAA